MQYNKDEAYNKSAAGKPLEYDRKGPTNNGTIPHPANSSWPTGVSFRKVDGKLLTTTGVTNSNEVDLETLKPVMLPFVYDDDLGAPYVGPTHATVVDGIVLHHFVTHVQDSDGDQEYVVTSIEPNHRTRDVIARISRPKASSWSSKASFQHMTLATSEYYIMIESSCYYPQKATPVGEVDWVDFGANEMIKTHVRLVDRKTGESTTWPLSTRLFAIHHINAYMDEVSNEIVIDTIRLLPGIVPCSMALKKTSLKDMTEKWKTDVSGKSGTYVVRLRIPLDRVGETVTPTRTGSNEVAGMEFPTIRYDDLNGKPYTFFYACYIADKSSGYYDSILKMNVQTGEILLWHEETGGVYPNEPIFVPDPDGTSEDDGVVLADVLDTATNTTFLVVLDARTMQEIGRAGPTPHAIPHGYHGRYFPAV